MFRGRKDAPNRPNKHLAGANRPEGEGERNTEVDAVHDGGKKIRRASGVKIVPRNHSWSNAFLNLLCSLETNDSRFIQNNNKSHILGWMIFLGLVAVWFWGFFDPNHFRNLQHGIHSKSPKNATKMYKNAFNPQQPLILKVLAKDESTGQSTELKTLKKLVYAPTPKGKEITIPISVDTINLETNLHFQVDVYSHDHEAFLMIHGTEIEELVRESENKQEHLERLKAAEKLPGGRPSPESIEESKSAASALYDKLAVYYQHSLQRLRGQNPIIVWHNDQKERFQTKNLQEIEEVSRRLVNMDFRQMSREEAMSRSSQALQDIERVILNPVRVVRKRLYYFLVYDEILKSFDTARFNIAYSTHNTLGPSAIYTTGGESGRSGPANGNLPKYYWPAFDQSQFWVVEEDLALATALKEDGNPFTIEIKFSIIDSNTYYWYNFLQNLMKQELGSYFDNLTSNSVKVDILAGRLTELGFCLFLVLLHLCAKLAVLRAGRFDH